MGATVTTGQRWAGFDTGEPINEIGVEERFDGCPARMPLPAQRESQFCAGSNPVYLYRQVHPET